MNRNTKSLLLGAAAAVLLIAPTLPSESVVLAAHVQAPAAPPAPAAPATAPAPPAPPG